MDEQGATAGAWVMSSSTVDGHEVVKVHPGSQFWTLQVWESIIFLGFGAALVLACYWWVRHRAS